MASLINYRFKSNREFSQIHFETNGLPLWELKHEIMIQRKMQSKDFDLLFYDLETDEQIVDEYTNIPRNSHIIVHRIPLWLSKNAIQTRERKTEQVPSKKFLKEPPENYICFRCGNKGHFIQHCPTNSDRSFDIVKIKKPSGIPKDFLERVAGDADGASAMLITDDGFVKALPQTQEWMKQGNTYRAPAAIPSDLKCPNCYGLIRMPILTNCGHSYCKGCIYADSKCLVCSKIVSGVRHDYKLAASINTFLGK